MDGLGNYRSSGAGAALLLAAGLACNTAKAPAGAGGASTPAEPSAASSEPASAEEPASTVVERAPAPPLRPDPATLEPLADPFVEVSIGHDLGCARSAAGKVWCWDDASPVLRETELSDAVAVRVVRGLPGAVCIIRGESRRLVCEGATPPPLEHVTWLGQYAFEFCAGLEDGETICWDRLNHSRESDAAPESSRPFAPGLAELVDGRDHYCGRFADGRMRCWGSNGRGQLGPRAKSGGMVTADMAPAGPAGGVASPIRDARSIATGVEHTCAATKDGHVSCWGTDYQGVLGDGPGEAKVARPVTVSGLEDVVDVASGAGWATCGRTASGEVWCWGTNYEGQLGDETAVDIHLAPVRTVGVEGATSLDVFFDRACATAETGHVLCWGGHGASAPQAVLGVAEVEELAACDYGACARRSDGAVLCWGDLRYVADDTPRRRLEAAPIDEAAGLRGLGVHCDSSEWRICGVSDGELVCVHSARIPGVLPVEASGAQPPRRDAMAARDAARVDVEDLACAVLGEGRVGCWVPGESTAVADVGVAAGARQVDLCGGRLLCWLDDAGAATCAELGWDAASSHITSADLLRVAGVTEAEELACINQLKACVRSRSGEVSCWRIEEPETLTSVAHDIAKLEQGCGITEDGQLRCWDGPRLADAIPQWEKVATVPGIDDAIDLVAERGERGHACVLHSDRRVSCWGANDLAQVGDGRGGGAVWAVPMP